MIVKYKGKKDNWIKENEECYVIDIFISYGENTKYRLLTEKENECPAYFNSSDFEIVDGKIPKNWVALQLKSSIEISPKRFHEVGFWERYFDGEPDALNIFEEEYKIIKE